MLGEVTLRADARLPIGEAADETRYSRRSRRPGSRNAQPWIGEDRALRRAGDTIAVREPGSTEWRYPAWQFDNGKPRTSIARVVAAARDCGLDDAKLYAVLTSPLGLRDEGRTLVDLLLEGREDEVVTAVRAAWGASACCRTTATSPLTVLT